MPSGARKRKATKKKMKNGDTSSSNNSSTTHSQASEDRRSFDDRESENGEIEALEYEERVAKEVLQKNGSGVVGVVKEESPVVILSSEDKEVAVVEEKLLLAESEESKAFGGNSVLESNEILNQDSIASVELVKDIVSLSQEINIGLGSSVTSELVESGLINKDDLALPISGEKEQFSSIPQDLQSEKVESKTVSVDEGKSSADPNPSTGLDAVETSEIGNAPAVTTTPVDNVKEVSTQKRSVDQTSNGINSLPIQRTSVLGCCGLFELFSGSNK